MVSGLKLKDSSKVISGSTNQTATSSLHDPVFSLSAAKWRNTETSVVSFESINLRFVIFLKITSRFYKSVSPCDIFPVFL